MEFESGVLELGPEGEWQLDLGRRELRDRGQRVELRVKPFQLLTFLVMHRDRVIPKDEVLGAVWPDTVVSDTALSSALKAIRQVLADDASKPVWIETKRGQGYRFIAPAKVRSEGHPDALPATDDPFVGRLALQTWVDEKLERSGQGQGQLVWVRGEAGIGKTRFLTELATRAETRRYRVLWGRCLDRASRSPLWPWTQILRGIDRGSLPATAEWDAIWRRVAPARVGPTVSDELSGGVSAGPSDHGNQDRFALFESLARVLRETAADTPLVLILDDLQWADEASLDALRLVAREISASPVFVAVSLRDAPTLPPALATLVGECARLEHSDRRTIPPLSDPDVRTLALARVGFSLPERLLDEIAERASGSPFFVRELARMMVLHPTQRTGGLNVPEGVVDVVRSRLSSLSTEAREALEVAAIIGQTVPAPLFERALRLIPDELRVVIDELVAAGFLRETGNQLEFEHDLVREAVQADLRRERIVSLHLRVGESLEEGDELDEPEDLARHFAAADTADGAKRAAHYGRRAGHRALRLTAMEMAIGHFRRALSALDRASAPDPALRTALLLDLGVAHLALDESDAARTVFLEAAELARSQGDTESLRAAALGPRFFRGDFAETLGIPSDPEVESLLEEALRVGPEIPDGVTTRIKARLGLLLLIRDSQSPRGNDLLVEAEVEAKRHSDPDVTGAVLFARYMAKPAAHPADRLELVKAMTSLGVQAASPGLQIVGMVPTFGILSELGDPDASHATDRLASWEDSQRLPWVREAVAIQRAASAFVGGDLNRAESGLTEVMNLVSRRKETLRMLRLGAFMAAIRREQGRLGEMLNLLQLFASRTPALGISHLLLARAFLEEGRTDEARKTLPAAAQAGAPAPSVALAWEIELAHDLGDTEAAPALLEEASRLLGLHAVSIVACLYLGPISRYAGLAAETANDLDRAAAHFRDAIAEAESSGALLWRGYAQLGLARVELEQGRDADPAILERLGQVIDFAVPRGLVALRRRAETVRDEALGAIPIRRRDRST